MSNLIGFKSFFNRHQDRIVFVLILIIASLISFQAGELKEREKKSANLRVILNQQEKMSSEDKEALVLGRIIQRKGITEQVESTKTIAIETQEGCNFIGSKNSDKYHTMDCQWASRIKEENRVCFKSEEEAREKSYQPGSCNNK